MKQITIAADLGDTAFVLYGGKVYQGTIGTVTHVRSRSKSGRDAVANYYRVEFHVPRAGSTFETVDVMDGNLHQTRESLLASL